MMTADRAAENLVRMMEDREVPFGVRAKIAQDLLDRAGLIATQVHQIIPMTEDPIIQFFKGAFRRPEQLGGEPPQPAIEEPVIEPNAEPDTRVASRAPPGRQMTRAVRPPSARRCCSIHAMPGPPN